MLQIVQNSNFENWFQIFAFGDLIDEIMGQVNAVEKAKVYAIHYRFRYIAFEDELLKV